MSRKMKSSVLAACCFIVASIAFLQAPTLCHGEEIMIGIQVAPSTLNIQSQSQVVTVHTNIAYSCIREREA